MFGEKANLIPRYNWDYGLPEVIRGIWASFSAKAPHFGAFGKVFKSEPVLTTSGRSALFSILRALKIPEGSSIGVPLFCCPVVFDAIRQAGYRVKFIDVELDDYNLSSSDLARKKENLKGLVVVHMFGHPADMKAIKAICPDIPLIEDCAQSLFSKWNGRYTGFEGTASFFSFRTGKYISVGEGAAIICNGDELREEIKRIANEFEEWEIYRDILNCLAIFGKSFFYKRPWYGFIGYSLGKRMDRKFNLTAKSGFQLKRMSRSNSYLINERLPVYSEKIGKQRQNALYFLKRIRQNGIYLPMEKEGYMSNYYQFAIRFDNRPQREAAAEYLFKNGIDSAKYLDEVVNIARAEYGYAGDCPNSETCSSTVLVVPNYYSLSNKDLKKIVKVVNII